MTGRVNEYLAAAGDPPGERPRPVPRPQDAPGATKSPGSDREVEGQSVEVRVVLTCPRCRRIQGVFITLEDILAAEVGGGVAGVDCQCLLGAKMVVVVSRSG